MLTGLTVKAVSTDQDGIHLTFSDGTRLMIYNYATLNGRSLETTNETERLLGLAVLSCDQSETTITLMFRDGPLLRVDLTDQAYRGPEALQIMTRDGRIIVWN